jgi:hypothetical protein
LGAQLYVNEKIRRAHRPAIPSPLPLDSVHPEEAHAIAAAIIATTPTR